MHLLAVGEESQIRPPKMTSGAGLPEASQLIEVVSPTVYVTVEGVTLSVIGTVQISGIFIDYIVVCILQYLVL